ncbi:PASTA domain-containing protein [Streptomyces sp. NPDC088752]|uniref:PASTA domain-containing protein n=1 Tax=Streptomyces sp. NPDC088752 TaxID=3154963 RepID=UPI00343FB0E6
MKVTHHTLTAAITAVAAAITLSACASEPSDSKPTTTATGAPTTVVPTPTTTPPVTVPAPEPTPTPTQESTPEPTEPPTAAAEVPEVPSVVGMNHADALTILHTAGFMVNEEDASPEGRMILMNSNWKVCSQNPAPGTPGKSVLRVAIYSVKLSESC